MKDGLRKGVLVLFAFCCRKLISSGKFFQIKLLSKRFYCPELHLPLLLEHTWNPSFSVPWENTVTTAYDAQQQRLPCGSAAKESTCNKGDLGSSHGLGRSPGEGKATHFSILAWRIPRTHGVAESDTTERLTLYWETNRLSVLPVPWPCCYPGQFHHQRETPAMTWGSPLLTSLTPGTCTSLHSSSSHAYPLELFHSKSPALRIYPDHKRSLFQPLPAFLHSHSPAFCSEICRSLTPYSL